MEYFVLLIVLLMVLGFVGVVFLVIRLAWGGVTWALRAVAGEGRPAAAEAGGSRCRQTGCRTANPPHARFCRRCGSAVAGMGPPPLSHVNRIAAVQVNDPTRVPHHAGV